MIHSRRPLEPVFHIAFWALLFALTFSATTPILNTESALLTSFLRVITLMTLAYVHLFLIIPLFFRKSKFIWYSLAVVVLLILSMIVNGFIFEFWLPFDIEEFPKRMLQFQQDRKRWMIGGPIPQLILTFATIFFTLVYALGKEFLEKEQQTTYLESEKIKHELSFLRTQINPHFLFNALNNLHATVQLNPEKAGEYILKLGDMLRYVLEDCRKDKVKLGEEITYIRNYIFFQEQRDHELQNITFDITGEDISDFELEPMLLIALVENAFIHSYTEQTRQQFVAITIELTAKQFRFCIQNNLPAANATDIQGSRQHHIGVGNVSRRLELLYPDTHSFEYGIRNEAYEAMISIKRSMS